MRIAIIGGGSVGGLIAYFLYRGGVRDIHVYYRSWRSVEAVEEHGGLTIVLSSGEEYFVPVKPLHHTMPYGKYDVVFNAVKAVDVESTAELMRSVDNGYTLYISLQNGFGSCEYMEELFTPYRVACGVVRLGAQRINPYTILERGIGSVVLGQHKGLHRNLQEITRILLAGGCPSWITMDIDFDRWLKLGVNAVINPLTAITRSKNKIVLTRWGMELARSIIEELSLAARLHGYSIDPDRLYRHVLRVARVTSENYSSMAQDILAGRPTEIDYINGFIVTTLERHGYKSIVNSVIVKIIHLIEESRIK